MIKKLLKSFTLTVLYIGVIAYPAPNEIDFPENETVSILTAGYVEDVAMLHLLDIILPERGVEVNTILLDLGPLYATLAKGDADLFLDSWLPVTHEHYWERFSDSLEQMSVTYDEASLGLVVPSYVEINSIEELNNYADEFNRQIIGIDSGAGIHRETTEAIEKYGLDYKQITSSEGAMMASLRRAVSANKPIVITGWQPHYMWDIYNLKMLEDPKNIYVTEKSYKVSRKNFTKDKPELAKFFNNLYFDIELLNELIGMVRDAEEESNNPQAGAKKFYTLHKDLIDSWFAN